MSDKDKLESPEERLERLTHEFDQAMRDAVPEADVQHLIRQYQDVLRVHQELHTPWPTRLEACEGADMGLPLEEGSTWKGSPMSANMERELEMGVLGTIRGLTMSGFDIVIRATTTRGTPA